MLHSIKSHIIFDGIPRTAVIDIYDYESSKKCVLYFPITKGEEKHIPYFKNAENIVPFNRESLPQGCSLLPSPCQAGMF
jgi:hypothetical protein